MDIRLARSGEYERVRGFYHGLINAMQDNEYLPGWEIEVYPASDELEALVNREQMYVGEVDSRIVAAMALNHDCCEGYEKCPWQVDAGPDEVTVIHMLCVHPDFARQGFAKQLVRYAIDKARADGQKALRLDVLKGNVPAERLYPRMGFELRHTLMLYYDDTGWTDYELYELAL